MYDQIAYGSHPDQFIRIHAPDKLAPTSSVNLPVVFVVHGGFWRQRYNVDNALVENFPAFFAARGWWTVMVEYRRCATEHSAGGWPTTNQDILLALQCLANSVEKDIKYSTLDMNQLVVIGHSAGGVLASWVSCSKLDEVITVEPMFQGIRRVLPKLCVPMAPIGNLVLGHLRRLSDDGQAISNYMGCEPILESEQNHTSSVPNCIYRLASPHYLLPFSCPSIIVAGKKDVDVPFDIVNSFYECAVAACSNDHQPESVKLLELPDSDHFSMVDVSSSHWQQVFDAIELAMK